MTTHTAVELLEELRALDVRLRVEDGRLRVNAPKGSLTPALEAALVARKQELVEVLSTRAERTGRAPMVAVSRNAAPLRLSFVQERLWVLEQLQPGQTAYNLAVCTGEVPDLDISSVLTALRRVVERHEILRSRYVRDGSVPVLRLADAASTPIVLRDLRGLSRAAQADEIINAADQATTVPFDLAAEAPVRFAVLQTGERSGALLISAHHLAVDAWSFTVLRREMTREYEAVRAGAPVTPPAALQYADFADWQRRITAGAGANERMTFWTDRLANLPQLSTIPTDHPRSIDTPGSGAAHDYEWPASLYDGVRALARDCDATVYMVLLAAVAVVLTRNAGQADVAIGSPIGTRDLAEMEEMLGPILNPLVLRFDLSDDPTFASVVARAREAVLDGHLHQDVPFEALVQALNPQRALGHSPLFQVAVVLHNAPEAGAMQIHGGGAIHDLTVFAIDRNGVLGGAIEYRTDLYDLATIERIDAQIQAVLTAATRDSAHRVSSMPLLSTSAANALRSAVNPAPVAVEPCSLVEQVARTALRHPTRIAVSATTEQLTYAALEQRANAVARALMTAGAGRGDVVALATDRSSAMVAGALGIMKAGAAYVPVDLTYPADRVRFMLRDSGARHLVTSSSVLPTLSTLQLPETVIAVDMLDVTGAEAPPVVPLPDDLAYMIYTSGSTGTPKGVRIPHRALTNFLAAMRVQPGISVDDVMLATTSLSFDISVLELFLPLVVGARTVIATRDDASDGGRLASLIRSAGVTMVQSTPSGWRLLMQTQWNGGAGITAISGGETLSRDVADWLCQRVRRVLNAYGPTETTVWSSMAEVTGGAPITVGSPILNTQIHVLDLGGHLAPIGAPGEICIGGDGVADGYHNQPDLTDTRFVPDPFASGRRMYRTGDFGRWRHDGALEHLGRADGQVKVRGYRIETGEIEAALAAHDAVQTAVVGVRNAAADDARLVAWVRLRDDADCTASVLRRHLRQLLPEHMIPSMISVIDTMPMTPNGKVDGKKLPDPFAGAAQAPREYVAPVTASERQIAEIWTRLLGVPLAGTTDSFFELGGHSLLAMQAASEMSERTGALFAPRLLFFRTLGQLAEECDDALAAGTRSAPRP